MSEVGADPPKRSHLSTWLACTALALALLYLLSFPPIQLLAFNRSWPWLVQFDGWFYAPLRDFLNSHHSVDEVYWRYYEWWEGFIPFTPYP